MPAEKGQWFLEIQSGANFARKQSVIITQNKVTDSALQRHIAGHAARLGKSMKVRARVTGFDAVCRMVEAGAGIGIVPEASAARCRPSMRIESVRLSDPWASRRLAICARDLRSLPTGALRLVAHLRAAAPPAS